MGTIKFKTFKSKILHSSSIALLTMFVWELVEELLENLIAYTISSVVALFITKAISTIVVVSATQGIKFGIKNFLVPWVRGITYKEGNDKMNKILQFFKWIWANKKTLIGTISTAVAGLSATDIIPVNQLPVIMLKGINVTPFIYYAALAILSLLGVFGVGIEKIDEFFNRKALIKAEKEEKAIIKEAEKELATEEKLANQTQSEQEKAKAKAEAEAQAKAEKEKAEAEHRAKVEQAKAKLLANKSK